MKPDDFWCFGCQHQRLAYFEKGAFVEVRWDFRYPSRENYSNDRASANDEMPMLNVRSDYCFLVCAGSWSGNGGI